MTPTLAVRRASLATCDRGPSDAGILADGALVVQDGAVCWIGPDAEAEKRFDLSSTFQIDARGRLVTPGLVDCHTHLLFGDRGEREEEFAELASGVPYVEIARRGGGILATARATRESSDEALVWGAVARARRLLAQGVTTVEVKSGYGLSVAEELRMLRLVREVARSLSGEMTVAPTLLALHAVPPELRGDRAAWVREVLEVLRSCGGSRPARRLLRRLRGPDRLRGGGCAPRARGGPRPGARPAAPRLPVPSAGGRRRRPCRRTWLATCKR